MWIIKMIRSAIIWLTIDYLFYIIMPMKKDDKQLKKLVDLDKKLKESPLSSVEQKVLEAENRFEATFYSNKLEGNKLSKYEARKAILSE